MSPRPAPQKQTHSTGPRTEAGKATSSRNALRHGLASGTLLVPGEDPNEWTALLTSLLEEWKPASATERLLVENMAKHHWLVERALRLQGEALAATQPNALPPTFALLLRYQTTNERAFVRAQRSLEEMQKVRREFVSQNREAVSLARMSAPFPPVDYTAVLDKLSLLRGAPVLKNPDRAALNR